MNAGNDVERAITGWLHETAVRRAPDRVLEKTAGVIQRTKQRPRAAWRDTMFSSTAKFLAAGVAIVAIALGAGLIGRSTADGGAPHSTPVPATASPASPEQEIARYRLERNLICAAALLEKDPLIERYDRVYAPDATDAERRDGIGALESFVELADRVSEDLAALDPPAVIADGHAAYLSQYRDMTSLIRHVVELLRAGRIEEASAVDRAIDVLNPDLEGFERANQLTACP